MFVVTIHEAKANLSKLVEQAERGEDVVISRGKQPVVRLVPIVKAPAKRQLGLLEGKYTIPDDFFDPLTPEELEAWGE